MKATSRSVVAVATLLLFLGTSFSTLKKDGPVRQDNIHYYFYLNGGTTYDGWYTTSQEIARLETMLGVYVDGNPLGGTLVASGYPVKGYPHYVYASVFLYTH